MNWYFAILRIQHISFRIYAESGADGMRINLDSDPN